MRVDSCYESWWSSVKSFIFIWVASWCGQQLIDGERAVAVAGFMSQAAFEYWGCVGVTLLILWFIWQCIIFKTCHTKDNQGLPCVWNYGEEYLWRIAIDLHLDLTEVPNWSLFPSEQKSNNVTTCKMLFSLKASFHFYLYSAFLKEDLQRNISVQCFKLNTSLLGSSFWNFRICLLSVNTQIAN